MTRRFEAVIFDMDGVLVDSEPVHFESTVRLLKGQFGVGFTEEDNREFLGSTDRHMFEVLHVRHRLPVSIDELIRRRKEIYLGLVRDGAPWRDGIRPLIADLSQMGYRLAVASSGLRRIIEHVLEVGAIRRHFDVVVSADDIPAPKPAPDIYLEAARRLKIAPPRCVAVEDTDVGVRAAKSAGMYAIAFPTKTTAGMDFGVADLVAEDAAVLRNALLDHNR